MLEFISVRWHADGVVCGTDDPVLPGQRRREREDQLGQVSLQAARQAARSLDTRRVIQRRQLRRHRSHRGALIQCCCKQNDLGTD